MSWCNCSYKDCMKQRKPCSSMTFFRLPQDEPRRTQWIVNSANEQLQKLTATQVRFFCETHFHPSDIREQFERKILRKQAVPMPHESLSNNTTNAAVAIETVRIMEGDNNDLVSLSTPLVEWVSIGNVETPDKDTNESDHTYTFEMAHNEEYNSLPIAEIVEENSTETSSSIHTGLLGTSAVNPNIENNNRQTLQISKDLAASDNAVDSINLQHEEYASDKHFALSLVYYFQRLSAATKARAKIQILSYLTALDMGLDLDLK